MEAGFEGAIITEIFQTSSRGSSSCCCISVSTASSPRSATRKLRMPASQARATSSTAYARPRAPRTCPKWAEPSAERACAPTSNPSRGPTNSETSMEASAPSPLISCSSATLSSIAPLPCETRFTVIPRRVAAWMTSASTRGPSTLGISMRNSAPSGKRDALAASVAGRGSPRRSSEPRAFTLRPPPSFRS